MLLFSLEAVLTNTTNGTGTQSTTETEESTIYLSFIQLKIKVTT